LYIASLVSAAAAAAAAAEMRTAVAECDASSVHAVNGNATEKCTGGLCADVMRCCQQLITV